MGKTDKKFIEWIKKRDKRDLWRATIFSEAYCKQQLMKYRNYSYPQTIQEQIETNYFYYWASILTKHQTHQAEIRAIKLKLILSSN